MLKVMTIFGTRPEAIKMAPLVRELLKHEEIDTKVCLTAQHREMLDQVVDLFGLPVDYDLDIMKSGQSLYDITARVLRGLEDVLKKEKPDYVLVHGRFLPADPHRTRRSRPAHGKSSFPVPGRREPPADRRPCQCELRTDRNSPSEPSS